MATKLECFILHRSEVVLTLALLYSHALSTEKHIFHKFLTRQIAHRSHHSALVILILFTPIKKRTAKHRAGRHESPQFRSLPMLATQRRFSLGNQSLTPWAVLGRVGTLIAYPFPSTGSCMAPQMLALVPHQTLPQVQQSHNAKRVLLFRLPAHPGKPRLVLHCALHCCMSFAVERMFKGTGPALKPLSLTRSLYKDHASARAIALLDICSFWS